MGLHLFHRREGGGVNATTMVDLTDKGKQLVYNIDSGGINHRILSELDNEAPQTVGRLCKSIRISPDEMKQRIKILSREGLVRITSTNEAYGDI